MVGLGQSIKNSGLDLDRTIWQSAHLWIIQEKEKCGNQAHLGSAKQKRFISKKTTKSQMEDVQNSIGFGMQQT